MHLLCLSRWTQWTLVAVMAAGAAMAALAEVPPRDVLQADMQAVGRTDSGATVVHLEYGFTGGGLSGKFSSTIDLAEGHFVDTLLAGPVKLVQGYDGEHAWAEDASGAVNLQEGGEDRQLQVNEGYRRGNFWWREAFAGATIISRGTREEKSQTFDVLEVTPEGGKTFEAWFGSGDHLLARTVEVQGSSTIKTTFSAYRREGGLMLPHDVLVEDSTSANNTQHLVLLSVDFPVALAQNTFSPPTSHLHDSLILRGAHETTVPFRLVGNHIYAEVSVNGGPPELFIFDSGGLNILTPTLAKDLGLEVQGHLAAGGAGEGVMTAGIAKGRTLAIGDALLLDPLFSVLPLDSLSNVEGIDEEGMVGYETFRRFVSRIDYRARTLTLIDPEHFDPKDAGTPIHFDYADRSIVVKGTFEGLPGRFRIDTGARDDVTLYSHFAEEHGLRAKHPNGVEAISGWGSGGPAHGYVVRAGELGIGPVEVSNVVASFSTDHKGVFAGSDLEGNIGGGVLKRFVVTLDYANQTLYLRRLPGVVDDIGTYDRAGLWINTDPKGFVIAGVTRGGPAEAAGLEVGDRIITVDGKAATSINLADLRARLRDGPVGTRVLLATRRDNQTRKVTLVLKDLI